MNTQNYNLVNQKSSKMDALSLPMVRFNFGLGLLVSLSLVFSLGLSLPAQAMHHEGNNEHHGMQHSSSSTELMSQKGNMAKTELTRAEVKRVQVSQGKITLKHEHIPAIDMPPMTMSFTAENPEMIKGLKRGDRVKFSTTDKLKLTHIEKVE